MRDTGSDQRLSAHNDALTAHGSTSPAVFLIAVRLGAAGLRRLSDIAAAATTAVELDAVALASDAVSFTAADRGGWVTHRRQGRGRGAARRPGRQGRADGAGRAVGVRVLIGHAGAGKAVGQVLHGGSKVGLPDLSRSVGFGGLGVVDLGWRQSSALDDVVGTSARLGSRVALATGDIEDVELAASGGLNGVFDGGVMRDVVSIHDILVDSQFHPLSMEQRELT
jgi:hypothetical protein